MNSDIVFDFEEICCNERYTIKATVVYRCSEFINQLRKKPNPGYKLNWGKRTKYKRETTTQQKHNI